MTFTTEQQEMLAAKLDHKHVKPPPQGKYGSYIEGWHAIAEANRIFGFDGWSYRVDSLTATNAGWFKVKKKDRNGAEYEVDQFQAGYMAMITVEAGGVSRQDVGHGQGFSKSEGDAHDSAIKEAVTDGLKRALKSFGNPFGLALYDKSGENVERSNGSTRPPAKHDVRTSEADVQTANAGVLATEIIRRFGMATNMEALNSTANHPPTKADIDRLPDDLKSKVRKAYAAKKLELNNPLGGG